MLEFVIELDFGERIHFHERPTSILGMSLINYVTPEYAPKLGWISNNYKYLCNIFHHGRYCKDLRTGDNLLFLRKATSMWYHVVSNFKKQINLRSYLIITCK